MTDIWNLRFLAQLPAVNAGRVDQCLFKFRRKPHGLSLSRIGRLSRERPDSAGPFAAPFCLGKEAIDLHFEDAWNSRAGTIFSASASNRASPRSGSSSGSTLIHPMSEPARS